MGLEDNIRRNQIQRAQAAREDAKEQGAVQQRADRANQLLKQLGQEALRAAQNRGCARALAVTAVIVHKRKTKIETGSQFWLFQPERPHINRISDPMGVLDSGQLVRYGPVERVIPVHLQGDTRIRNYVSQAGEEAAHRAGCVMPAAILKPCVAHGEPPDAHFGRTEFFLADSGELMFGSHVLFEPAETVIAKQFA